MKIKLIIFDLGGVLTLPKDSLEKDSFEKIAEKYKIAPENFDDFFYKFFEDYHFKRTLSQFNFWKKTISQVKKDITDDEINEVIEEFNKNYLTEYNEDVVGLVKELSKKYKLVVLSNSSREMDKSVFSSFVIRYFDRICLSHMNSPKKPDKEAFAGILKDFDVKPEEAVFIDDKEKNIQGAKQLGINTIHFKGYDNLVKELGKIGIEYDDNR